MRALDLARRLIASSAILVFGAIAISVMTRDEWRAVAHALGIVGAVVAALGVLLLFAAGLRRWGAQRPRTPEAGGVQDHELGQAGWDEPAPRVQPDGTPGGADRAITSVHDIMSRQR